MQLLFFEFPFASIFYDESIALRNDILRVPLGLEFESKDLSLEFNQIHLGCFSYSLELLACLVMVPISDGNIKMRQVAVVEAMQGKGLGTYIVQQTEQYCKENGYQKIILNARETSVSFYLRMDYKKIGNKFTEVNIPHYKMYKNL